ncbi:MAG: hypothetical protein IPN09_12520 [Bacteroidetes bacterium]|nr:hypothetical protein [Bacteroidota bacterium]
MMESANYRLVKTSIEDKKAISDLLGMPEFLMRFEEDPIKVNIELYFDNLLNINNFVLLFFRKKKINVSVFYFCKIIFLMKKE